MNWERAGQSVCILALAAICGCAVAPAPGDSNTTPAAVVASASSDDANAVIASAVPSTDIVLVPLASVLAGTVPSTVRQVVQRRGYDNQPAFTLDGSAILFASIRDDQQSDVFRYELASGKTTQITRSPQSEYSPTPMAGGGFSCVQVALDGTQRLWRYSGDGAPVAALRPDLTAVGYHAWLTDELLALFIVDDPPRLALAALGETGSRVVASDIGRALHRTAAGTLGYVRKKEVGGTVHELDVASGRDVERAALPGDTEDLVWLNDGSVLVADEGKLYRLTPGARQWREVVDLAPYISGGISRMAVDPAGLWLALVVAESAD